jgi:hypothetical protein
MRWYPAGSQTGLSARYAATLLAFGGRHPRPISRGESFMMEFVAWTEPPERPWGCLGPFQGRGILGSEMPRSRRGAISLPRPLYSSIARGGIVDDADEFLVSCDVVDVVPIQPITIILVPLLPSLQGDQQVERRTRNRNRHIDAVGNASNLGCRWNCRTGGGL